jgi:hypothetical protein
MKHISTGAVFVGASMFLFFIFAASFLAGECAAAAGEEQKDDHRVHGNTGVGVEKKVDHHVVLPQQQEKPNQPEAVNSSAAAGENRRRHLGTKHTGILHLESHNLCGCI